MTPFQPEERDVIRRKSKWSCESCGKSSFDKEKWLIEASHNTHGVDGEGGEALERICHLMKDLDKGDIKSVGRIANRIWNSGLRHMSEYEKHPELMKEDRLQLTELLTALGLTGQVHIKEEVPNVRELRAYVAKQMAKIKR